MKFLENLDGQKLNENSDILKNDYLVKDMGLDIIIVKVLASIENIYFISNDIHIFGTDDHICDGKAYTFEQLIEKFNYIYYNRLSLI